LSPGAAYSALKLRPTHVDTIPMTDFTASDLRLMTRSCAQSKSRATREAAERVDEALAALVAPSSEPLQLHVDDVLALTSTCQYSLKSSVREAAGRVSAVVDAVKLRVEIDPGASTVAQLRH